MCGGGGNSGDPCGWHNPSAFILFTLLPIIAICLFIKALFNIGEINRNVKTILQKLDLTLKILNKNDFVQEPDGGQYNVRKNGDAEEFDPIYDKNENFKISTLR